MTDELQGARQKARYWHGIAKDLERNMGNRADAVRAEAYRQGQLEGRQQALEAVSQALQAMAERYAQTPVMYAVAVEIDKVASGALGVKQVLKDAPHQRGTIAEIVEKVSDETGISPHYILGQQRIARYVYARHEAMRRAYATGRYSLTQIGAAFKRDHTSVLSGIRQATLRLETP